MTRTGRPGLSAGQKAELWQRWKLGQSLSDIGRALGKHAGSVHGVLSAHGGIIPATRSRAPRVLSLAEREEISRGIAAGASRRQIATKIGRSPSTIGREIARNGGYYQYRASEADAKAWYQAHRPKPCLLSTRPLLQAVVAGKLSLDWSPAQISGWLKYEYPEDEHMRVSPETIYQSLFIQARGVLKRELIGHLRSTRMMRCSKYASTEGQPRGRIVNGISIHERPAEIEDRAIPGHWEGDLITGSKNTHIATLVERHSRFTMLVKVAGKDTHSVVTALSKQVRKLPTELRKSLTWDRGMELAHHKKFTVSTNVQVYFCDPQSPWQRGTNENTNRLLRQYFPKSTNLSGFTQSDLNKIALRLNQRPRKTLGFCTPADKLNAYVALTS